MRNKVDLIIKNCSTILTFQGPDRGRVQTEMTETSPIENSAVAINNGVITWVGPKDQLSENVMISESTRIHDARNCAVLPGMVECHTHLVFAGTRENEFAQKIAGVPYMQIAAEGGGIKRTVKDTRAASEDELYEIGLQRIDEALKLGITSIEIKSGYGLDFETEMKMLRVAKKLSATTPVNIVTTLLGAHEIPADRNRSEYLDEVCNKMIPYAAKHKLADFCDVFCEKGVYTVTEAERVLQTGIDYGLKPKIHADQMSCGGGAELAARVGAISADHIDYTDQTGIEAMAEAGVVGVILPGAVFFLGLSQYPPARKMIESGVPVAISTDFNPGSCMSLNLHLMMTMACVTCRMTIEEALTAVTYNAACAIDQHHAIGSIEPGKNADLIILDCPNPEMIAYHFGHNHVRDVFCHGDLVVNNGMRVTPGSQ